MFTILAGDLPNDTIFSDFGTPRFIYKEGELKQSFIAGLFGAKDKRKIVEIPCAQIETYEVATEESVKRMGGAIGWGAAGAILLGPVGLLAGALAGGNKKEIMVACKLKDGRKFIAKVDPKTHAKILAHVY